MSVQSVLLTWGSLSRLPGLMREASDMQRVAKEAGAGNPKSKQAAPSQAGPTPLAGDGDKGGDR